MVKAVVALLLSLVFVSKPPSLSISPVPPSQGGTAVISADGPTPVHATIEWTDINGNVTQQSIVIGGSGQVEVDVPADATSMRVTDDDGIADGDSSVIEKAG